MSNWLPILAYHRVCDVPRVEDPLHLCARPRDLERVLRYLTARRYRLVSLDTAVRVLARGNGRRLRLACLTFDDGYRDFYTTAFPILRRYGAPATVFVVAGRIGDSNRWDDGYGLPPVPLLNAQEIREMAASGIDFGSHTLTHPRLTQLDAAEQRREIFESKRALEELLGRPVPHFCYPHMDQDERVRALVRDAGYRAAFGGEQAANDLYLLHRVNVSQTNWLPTLFRLWGWRHALQRSARLRSLKRAVRPAGHASGELTEVRQ